MGVSGLLPLLKSIHRPTELKKFAGQTLGVDAYGWLHRGAIACAVELAQGKPTRKYVDFAMHRVRMLRHFGVTPYLVFDGDYLPSKAMTEGSREKRREDSKKAGMELLKAGKPSQAFNEFQKAIDVTPEMARNLIDELKQLNIAYVVAPYEADAQLVYLERQGLIHGILSEDSDLLVFGCKRLLTKLDQYGNCIEVNRRDFCAVREVSLTGWTDADFRRMAILSGCDYLAGVNNMGLKTAYRMIRKYKTPERLIRMIQFEGKHRISEDYHSQFTKAELTFLHQRVFCPNKQELVCLTEPPEGQGVEDMPFIGGHVEAPVARAIAAGDVNPMTKLPIVPAPMPDFKRRHSQSASRATASTTPAPSRTQRSDTPAKPIDSYFKAHRRIPMGAMDPNCFSVDPQRVAALTDGGLVPRVFPLPRPYIDEPPRPYIREAAGRPAAASSQRPVSNSTSPRQLRRRSEPIGNLLARASGADIVASRRQSTNAPSSIAAEVDALMMGSSQRPPKKARLCSDQDVAAADYPEPAQRSKFFPQKANAPGQKNKDAFLFSDDSIDEALLNLPDLDGWHEPAKPRRSIMVFEEAKPKHQEATSTVSPPSTSKDDAPNTPEETTAYAEELTESTVESDILTLTNDTPPRPSLQQFSYSSMASAAILDTPASTESRSVSSVFTPSTAAPSTAASSVASSEMQASVASKPPALTPLQQLGARALQRKAAPRLPRPLSRPPNRSPERRERKLAQRLSLASVPINPSFVPLPKVDLDEVEALSQQVGSEDFITRESDGESETETGNVDQENPTSGKAPALNLSRFAYA